MPRPAVGRRGDGAAGVVAWERERNAAQTSVDWRFGVGEARVKARERHRLVDTLGLPISIAVTSAGTHDKVGAWHLLAGLKPLVPRLERLRGGRQEKAEPIPE